MIAIDLECSQGHMFEGWFDSLESFEKQKAQRLVNCPFCSDASIKRVLSPVALRRSTPSRQETVEPIDYQRLAREVVDYIHKNFDDVGPNFTAEALKMHYGVVEKRNIRGSATSEEEKCLKDEGIEFFKIPLPKQNKDRDN